MDELHALVQARYGIFWVNVKDFYLGKAILEYGEYSENEIAFLKSFLKKGDHFIDIGAHAGYIAIPLAMHVGQEGQGYAFEPQAYVFDLLGKNIVYNKVIQLSAFNFGISEQNGFADQFVVQDWTGFDCYNMGGVSFKNTSHKDQKHKNDARLMNLDQLNIKGPIRLMKIDVEGMEMSVLKGTKGLIQRDKPILYLEWSGEEDIEAYKNYLSPLGYVLKLKHLPFLFNQDNYFENQHNLYPQTVSKNVLFIHQDDEGKI